MSEVKSEAEIREGRERDARWGEWQSRNRRSDARTKRYMTLFCVMSGLLAVLCWFAWHLGKDSGSVSLSSATSQALAV